MNHTFQNTIVPHIHPSHTTTVNHHNFQHVHSFPHTESVVNEVTNQQFVAPAAPVGFGGPVPGAVAPGFGAPGFGAPGFGAPGFGAPGFGAPGFGAPGPFFRK